MIREITVVSRRRSEFIDITGAVAEAISELGLMEGLVLVYVPHTTAGITINENADPDVIRDIMMSLEKMVPWDAGYSHVEGNAAAHVKASLMGSSVTVPVEGGAPRLGTWQGIFFAEFDGPRQRKVFIRVSR